MNDSLMICTQEVCTQASNYFFLFPTQRLQHKQHKAFHVHQTTFIDLFDENELFANHEIEKISSKLEQQYSQMRKKIQQALKNAFQSHCQSNLKLLHTFKSQNEAGFARMLEMTAKGQGSQSYLQIALLALKHEDKASAIKVYIKEAISRKFEEFKGAMLKVISILASLQVEKSLQKTQKDLFVQIERPFQPIWATRMEEQQKPISKDPQPLPQNEQRQIEDIIWPQHQSNHQSYTSKQNSQAIDINDSSLQFNTQEQSFPQVPERKIYRETVPKFQLIKKHKKRGRPFKQPKSNYNIMPVYDSVFLQTDMDLFFPKGSKQQLFVYISEYSKSPCFKNSVYSNVVMGIPADYRLAKQQPRIIEQANELTVIQKHTLNTKYIIQQKIKLTATFELFQRPSHLIYFHLKEASLDKQSWESMRLLLVRNVQSLKTLMIEQCRRLPQQITELIKYLKLHSSYDGVFPLCLEHILKLEGLRRLSLYSAQFVDQNWDNIKENDEIFKKISRLSRLNHLCLYNCYPVYDQFLGNLHPNLRQTLTHLNLGITDITKESVPTLRSLKNLIQLSIDETQLNGKDIIKIFDNSRKNLLNELGVWRLNKSEWKIGKRGFSNGSITKEEMNKLTELLPKLEYINIAHCIGLEGYNLFNFPTLKYACVGVGMYLDQELKRLRKKITVCVDPQQYVQTPPTEHINQSVY